MNFYKRHLKITIVIITSAFSIVLKANTLFDKTEEVCLIGKIWTIVKYKLPDSLLGKIQPDSMLMADFSRLLRTTISATELNAIVDRYLKLPILEQKDNNSKCDLQFPDDDWLLKKLLDNTRLDKINSIASLPNINKYATLTKHAAPDWDKDNLYYNEKNLSAEKRLLGFFRLWGVLNNFYPYRKLIRKNFDSLAVQFVPLIIKASNINAYNVSIAYFLKKLNDGHALILSNEKYAMVGYYQMPFGVKRINDKYLISEIWNKGKCSAAGIEIGDELLQIDRVAPLEFTNRLDSIVPASNNQKLQSTLDYSLSCNKNPKVKLSFRKRSNNEIVSIELKLNKTDEEEKKPFKMHSYNEKCGYIDITQVNIKELDKACAEFHQKPYLILDLRGYPMDIQHIQKELAKLIGIISGAWCLGWTPTMKYFNCYYYDTDHITNDDIKIADSSLKYKGHIILLVNDKTVSLSEAIAMEIQEICPKLTIVGQQTAGCDGGMCNVFLPGNIVAFFTGSAMEYPDGKQSQINGIPLDVKVEDTEAGIKLGKDEILDKALQLINENK
jgi:C-terminal processing protease CtpA/Prc